MKADDERAEQPRPARPSGGQSTEGEGNEPDYRALFRKLVERANRGEPEAVIRLREFLDVNPAIWEKAGDLTAVAERAWMELIAGADRLTAESIGRRVTRIKADLAGQHPTPLEALLVDQVVVSWLAAHGGEIQAAVAGGTVAQAALRLRRAESGQRRLLKAVKTLSTLRTLVARGLAPLNSVRLFTPERELA
jgi:hypothetical protein